MKSVFISKKERRKALVGGSFITIAVVLACAFAIYPIINSLILSTTSGRGVVTEFVGLGNVKRILNDAVFKTALKNTFIFFVFQVPIMLTLALFIASLLNDRTLKFKGLYRTAIFLPCVTSLVAYSILFKSMFSADGIVNQLLLFTGMIDAPIAWLRDAFWAKVTVVTAITWRWTGYNMIFYLAGLQNIDPSIYEASEIDGATKTRQFFSITIPLLKPVILFTSIMSTIGTLQLFDEVVNLTGGGASTPSLNATLTLTQYIFDLSFKFVPNFGYAATVSYVIVFFTAILAFLQFRMAGDDRG